MANWQAGLDNQDEMSQFPSAASPLFAEGLDPDEVRANPELLARLRGGRDFDAGSVKAAAPNPPVPAEQSKTPSTSAVVAGKIGGAGDTTNSPSAPTPVSAPASTSQDELLGYGKEGLGLLNRNLKGATDQAESMSTTPPADIARLTAQREKLAIPAPLFDPQTGKRLAETQEYDPQTGKMETVKSKPSIGSRIWRGVRGGLEGFAMGGPVGGFMGAMNPGTMLGGKAYGDPTDAYQRAEQRREQQLGATDTELGNTFKTWKDAVDASKAKAGEYRANATLGKDLTTGATGLINAENKPETEANKDEEKFALGKKEFTERRFQLQSDPALMKLSPLQKALYMANGKLPDPKEPNEADLTAANIARGITILGHQPTTLEEWNKVISAAKGDLGKGKGAGATTQQSRSINDAKDAHRDRALAEYAKDPYIPPAPGQPDTPGSRDSLLNLQRELQSAQNKYEEDISLLGGDPGPHLVVTVDDKGFEKWTPQTAPTAAPTPAPAAQAPPAPAATPPPAPPAQAAPSKPQPAPDGTRRQAPDGKIEVKKNGKWEKE